MAEMDIQDRQRSFKEASRSYFKIPSNPRLLFGVSNSAKIIEGGIQLGVVNLDNDGSIGDSLVLACVLRFPPEDEVYFSVLIRKDISSLRERLSIMKSYGSSGVVVDGVGFAEANNNVPVYIAGDGKIWLRNKGFWDSLIFETSVQAPSIEIDKIAVALYPPTASARRSLLAREFIGWLGGFVGKEKIHELAVWHDAATLSPLMQRLPKSISISEIELAVKDLGGYYPNGEVRRFHASLNFLDHKHFVILSGLSGTGKTQLALKYARAVHGLKSSTAADPLIFECPVRPEWTDPSGLTGYFDVLTNRYVVPTFLEAVLVATAHRNSPVFVILDEMNLARVEYYLSDVLSCMETGGALQLHSNSIPLEGTTGVSVRAEIPLPPNLFIIGTINVDETTNPVSDKVLDRASVIEMSNVDLIGFFDSLALRKPELADACLVAKPILSKVHDLMGSHGMGFGYRLIEEFACYHAFDAKHLGSDSSDVTDQLLVQKVLVKLRGSERQRSLLTSLSKVCSGLPRAQAFIQKLLEDLDEFGSFQAMR